MGVGWGGFDINNGLLTFIDAKYEDWDATISSCPIHHNRCIYTTEAIQDCIFTRWSF